MHLLFTFADPLFQHYARFFEIKFSIKDKDSPPKVGKSFFSSKEREGGGGVNLKMKVILHSILSCFIMSYLLVLRF